MGHDVQTLLPRLRDPGRTALLMRVTDLFHRHKIEDWDGCFVVATERKVRVRRSNA